MAKFGIYLGYAPEQKLNDQGLGRLLIFILKGIIENNTESKIPVAMPLWYKKLFIELIDEHNISINNIELITTEHIPLIFRLRDKAIKKEQSVTIRSKLANKIKEFKVKVNNHLFKVFVGNLSLKSVVLMSFLFASSAMLLILLSLPILLCFVIISGITIFIINLLNKHLPNKINRLKKFTNSGRDLKNDLSVISLFDRIREHELLKLAEKINLRSDIDRWFVPTLFWPEIKYINAKKVITVPDIVFYDFPSQFRDSYWIKALERVEETVGYGDKFICYSEYVKQNQICKRFNVKESNISVIHHGYIDMSQYLVGESSIEILSSYIKEKFSDDLYLNGFPIHDCDYIFYASQNRPHKNILTLVKAYNILLKKRFIPIKLVLTGRIYEDKEISQYIDKHGLHLDIISLFDVPTKVLAALNKHALCHVNPTLFEGGFPFTFSEAYSVGTPSSMGRIAMVQEIVSDYSLYPHSFFDPHSPESMANSIEWVIKNRNLALDEQKILYEKIRSRTWKKVASEYIKEIVG